MMNDALQVDALHVPLLGNSVAIGIVSLLHIALASPAVTFMVLAPIAETLGRSRPHYTELAHTMTRFTLVTYTASLVLAVIMIELFVGLFPLTNSWLFNQFRLSIGIAMAAFLLQLFVLYPYYHYWHAIRGKNVRLHIALGVIAAVCIMVWVGILDGIGSFMLTPGEGQPSLLNPTFFPLVLHRFFGDMVVAGFLVGGYGAWRLRRAAEADRTYYRHMTKVGVLLGAIALLLQPLTGLLYAQSIQRSVPAAYAEVVGGAYQPLVYLQFTLIALLFVGTLIWIRLTDAWPATWPYVALLFVAMLMLVSVGTPAVRRVWTMVLVVSTAWIIWKSRAIWTHDGTKIEGVASRWVATALSVCALLTYLTMGTIRETARHPDTVRGIISLEDEAAAPAAFRHEMGPSPSGVRSTK